MWPRGDPRATSLQPVSGELGVTQPRPSRWAEPWRGTRPPAAGAQGGPASEAFSLVRVGLCMKHFMRLQESMTTTSN